MGKSDANECNESSLSNCRVQLALSTKKDGMILEQISSQEGGDWGVEKTASSDRIGLICVTLLSSAAQAAKKSV